MVGWEIHKRICFLLKMSTNIFRDRLGSVGVRGSRRRNVEWTWTNFHCALCLGVSGFIIFWIFILARYINIIKLQYTGDVHFIAIFSLPAQIVIESKVLERFPFVRVIDNLLLSSPGSHMLVLRSKT